MKNIRHIVYVMLENRSLDNVLGWLYNWKIRPRHVIPPDSGTLYGGLKPQGYYNLDKDGNKHFAAPITDGSMQVPPKDPHEPYLHVNYQLFETSRNPPHGTTAKMGGFYRDYASIQAQATPVMQSYTPEDLPVINELARSFAVSDQYYASIPTQTNCNRAFAATGNSLGHYYKTPDILEAWVDNHWGTFEIWDLDVTFSQPTIWEVLNTNHYASSGDWSVFYSQIWPFEHPDGYCFTRDLFPALQHSSLDDHFQPIDEFHARAKNDQLPTFSFLEPAWCLEKIGIGWNGNDYHPPANLCPGEQFLHRIYEALASNKAVWESTMLIINFDEHGGTYDHIGPGWGALTPWEHSVDGTPEPSRTEHDFDFRRYGVRVPLVLVSPYIEESTVIRSGKGIPFDHCSVVATVLEHFQVPRDRWGLGSRVAHAPTFSNIITRDTPRRPPTITPRKCSGSATDAYPDGGEAPVTDFQRMIAHRMIMTMGRRRGIELDTVRDLYEQNFTEEVQTLRELGQATEVAVDGMK